MLAANNRATKKKGKKFIRFYEQRERYAKREAAFECKSNMIFIHNFNVTCTDVQREHCTDVGTMYRQTANDNRQHHFTS